MKPRLIFARDCKLETGVGPHDADDHVYGIWECEDGSAYLFNRHYETIYFCERDGAPQPCKRGKWVNFIKERHFWSDSTPRKRRKEISDAVLLGIECVASKP